MKRKKYYVVWRGRKIGIFENFESCKKNVDGFPGAEYMSFGTKLLAEEAYAKKYTDYKKKIVFKNRPLKLVGEPDMNSISVDAACSGNPGLMEYQGVETETRKIIFKKGPYYNSTNNIGEFLALVHALALMKTIKKKTLIYSDSKTAISWVNNKSVNTKLIKSKDNKESFELIRRATKWLENNTFENRIVKWETKNWGEIPADFNRK